MVMSLALISYASSDLQVFCETFFQFYMTYHRIQAKDIYVIVQSTRNDVMRCVNKYEPNIIGYDEKKFDDRKKTKRYEKMQHHLLKRYRTVLISDLDERFLPNPLKYMNIHEFIKADTRDFIAPTGWEVLPSNQSINWNLRLLDQAQNMARLCGMDKPVLSHVPLQYTFSTHAVKQNFSAYSCGLNNRHSSIELLNIHIKCIDTDIWTKHNLLDTDRKASNTSEYIRKRCFRKQWKVIDIPPNLKVF